jgi:hypothetical protein
MKAIALAEIVLDSVLRGLQKALPLRVDDAVSARTAPLVEQVGALASAVEQVNAGIGARITRAEHEEERTRTLDAFVKMSRTEMQKVVQGFRIQADVEGFLWLSSERDGVRVALGFRPFQYHGTYEAERKYFQNDAVTNRGSLWIARTKVEGIAPGTDDGAQYWTLAVKCGKDAKPSGNGRASDGN